MSSKFHFQRCIEGGNGRWRWTSAPAGWGVDALSLSVQLPFALQIDVLHPPPRMLVYAGIDLISFGLQVFFFFGPLTQIAPVGTVARGLFIRL